MPIRDVFDIAKAHFVRLRMTSEMAWSYDQSLLLNPSFAGLVVLAESLNPIPFRTRPLNFPAPMVLSLKTWKSRSLPGLQRTDFPSTRFHVSETPAAGNGSRCFLCLFGAVLLHGDAACAALRTKTPLARLWLIDSAGRSQLASTTRTVRTNGPHNNRCHSGENAMKSRSAQFALSRRFSRCLRSRVLQAPRLPSNILRSRSHLSPAMQQAPLPTRWRARSPNSCSSNGGSRWWSTAGRARRAISRPRLSRARRRTDTTSWSQPTRCSPAIPTCSRRSRSIRSRISRRC